MKLEILWSDGKEPDGRGPRQIILYRVGWFGKKKIVGRFRDPRPTYFEAGMVLTLYGEGPWH